jgi:hypothetical protein
LFYIEVVSCNVFSTCCCFVYFLSQQYIRNLSNIPHAFFYNVFYAVYIKGGLNCHKLSSLYIENDNDRLNNVIFWGFIFERNAEWKDTCWWGKYLSMKRIWYIPGTLFLYFAVFAIPNRKKTISYHKKKQKLNRFVSLFLHYILSLSLFLLETYPNHFIVVCDGRRGLTRPIRILKLDN